MDLHMNYMSAGTCPYCLRPQMRKSWTARESSMCDSNLR